MTEMTENDWDWLKLIIDWKSVEMDWKQWKLLIDISAPKMKES